MGSVELTTTGAHSLNLEMGSNKLRFGWGQWTEVRDPDYMRWLTAPTLNGAILREKIQLSPYYLKTTDAARDYKVYFDRKKSTVRLCPDTWTVVDRVEAHYLLRQDGVVGMTADEVLELNPKSQILIKREGGLGDLMFLTAAVKAFRKVWPDADITLATKNRYVELMSATNLFTNVVDFIDCYDLAPFTLTADLVNLVEVAENQHELIRTEILANGLGVSCDGDYKGIFNHDFVLRDGLIPNSPQVVAVDLTGSIWMRGPTPDHAKKIILALSDAGFIPVGIHWKKLPWWPEGVGIDLNGCDWEDYVAVLDNSTVLSVDTGTLHVANAMDRPTVGLFGPIPAYLRVQGHDKCVCIESPGPCRFCTVGRIPCHGNRAICFNAIPITDIVDSLREVQKWL